MATSSKRAKKSQEKDVTSTDEAGLDCSGGSSSAIKPCIICGKVASSKIIKNQNFGAMMQLYWCTLGVDIKPEACTKSDVCTQCFKEVVKYFETNDIIVYFENYFKSLRLDLLKKTFLGISAWEKNGHPLTRIHQEIKKRYNNISDTTEPEEEQIRQTLGSYNMECFEITDSEENGESKTRAGLKLSRKELETAGTPLKKDGKPHALKLSLKNVPSKAANGSSSSDSDDD